MKEKEKKAAELVKFLSHQKFELYDDKKLLIKLENSGDIDELTRIINEYNYIVEKEIKGETVSKRLPVIVQTKEHLGRFYVQYTNHNFICGYKSLETGEEFKFNDGTTLCTSGDTVTDAVQNLWKNVEPKLGKFTSVTYSDEEKDLLNNID